MTAGAAFYERSMPAHSLGVAAEPSTIVVEADGQSGMPGVKVRGRAGRVRGDVGGRANDSSFSFATFFFCPAMTFLSWASFFPFSWSDS